MKKVIGIIALAIGAGALGGCETTAPASPSETAGPGLQSAYCIQHPNEPRCLRP